MMSLLVNAALGIYVVMGELRTSGTIRSQSHWRLSDKGRGNLLDFCQHVPRRIC
ncbi:MAG: hypothetical protein IPK22_27210 [Verrucomicrobiaceae bacterium]|nr:hypothetical protein [Verrucomicrobiaceae bacterium]